uniref:Peroxidase n=1 Tax=Acrobeloides nanus TaxID=290746 RepID=A0A914BYC7_9BILA
MADYLGLTGTGKTNFPCGKSFFPCDKQLGVAFGVKNNEIDIIERGASEITSFISPQRDQVVKTVSKFIDNKNLEEISSHAKVIIDDLFNKTEKQLYRDFRNDFAPFSSQVWGDLTKMDKYSKEMSYSALISIEITKKLQEEGLSLEEIQLSLPEMPVEQTILKDLCPLNLIQDCIPGKYRTYSGHCNNVMHPLWGAKYEPMQRLQFPDYSDGVSKPRSLGHTGHPLPSPRIISKKLFTVSKKEHNVCSLMLAQWSQFIYEDIAQVGSNRLYNRDDSLSIPCCADPSHPECLPIPTEGDDEVFKNRGLCIPYTRSFVAPRENCTLGVREQGNLVTSFLDGSQIYGNDKEQADELRLFQEGQLKSRSVGGVNNLLPPDPENTNCGSASGLHKCFQTGSEWVNLFPTGAAMHTIWMRHHNSLAKKLKGLNPHWDDEKLYQEARRIVIAQLQHVTYNEFLPIIVGKENLRPFGLQLRFNAFDSDYNIRTNPSILNEYASTVGLFFFSLLPDTIFQYDKNGDKAQERHLSVLYNDPSHLYYKGRIEGLLRYLLKEPVRKPGLHMSLELRDKFLKGTDDFGVDLAAMIIQMGRDHGINSYTAWRTHCGLSKPNEFEDLREIVLDSVALEDIATLYTSVDDVDLFVLGLAEKPMHGALVGPTFACVIGKQFEKLRRGDRFWYENFFQPSAFSEDQLAQIRKTLLAHIICENSGDIGKVQPNVFEVPDNFGNCPMDCNTTSLDHMDLKPWVDQEPRRKLPITKKTLEKALRLGTEQYRRLELAEFGRISQQRGSIPTDRNSAVFTHSNLMAPKRESLDLARTAGILRETTKVLLRGEGLSEEERLPSELDNAILQQLLPEIDVTKVIGNFTAFLGPAASNRECLPQPLPCDHTTKYRTFSGWCNNLKFPHYGNAFGPLRRLLDPAYDDGFDSPRSKARDGRRLPSARKISNIVHNDQGQHVFHVKFSHMVMQFGQIIDHDMTHSPIARGPNNTILNCSRCDSYESLSIHCFPISIDVHDPHFPHLHNDGTPRCMPFARSLLGQVTLGYRNQINQLTSYLDASYIYGSTECEANALRLFSKGRLNFTDLGYNKEALPQGTQERDCRSRPRHPCFNAGDERNNEQPGLTVLHTILLREHNKIATKLHEINNFWADEQLFEETRRILVAKLQHVIYSEWLPVVIGCEAMARYDLTPKKVGYYEGYDDHCDASISQELATAAMRFGHTLIRNHFPRMDGGYNHSAEPVDLQVNFNNATSLYDAKHGHMESILMGLLGAAGMDYDRLIVDAVRNHLFQKPGGPLTGLDLPAINIQRGRDHGIQSYNSYRPMCGLSKAFSFDDLIDTMDESAVAALKSVYTHVDDIDLFPGIMSERPIKGALVGPTLACIIAEQMQRLKKCDRFYYENNHPMTRFTTAQLAEIRKTTMSKIICENSQYAKRIQPNSFLMPDDLTNAPINCSEMQETDLYEWLDRQFCVVDQRVINLGKTRRVTPCITCTCTAEGPECHSITVDRCESLLDDYLFAEIKQDTVCVIQCSQMIKARGGRL